MSSEDFDAKFQMAQTVFLVLPFLVCNMWNTEQKKLRLRVFRLKLYLNFEMFQIEFNTLHKCLKQFKCVMLLVRKGFNDQEK